MARGFSETERNDIREKLIVEGEKSWAILGYKKTNIDELCNKVGISKGAFYSFFDSKEMLFCEILDNMQHQHIALVKETISSPPSKESICQMLKKLYLEYDRTNILVQRNSPDFASFLNRAPQEWREKSLATAEDNVMNTIFTLNLKLKMSKEKALGIFNALLSILTSKHIIGYDHYEVFCTLLDNIINEIYE